jgi:peptidoglycan hydrolase-like protein with peptidoglycan-binding domain
MRGTALVAASVVVAGVVAVTLVVTSSGGAPSDPTTPVPTSTAEIVRTDLSTTTQEAGNLGYAGTYNIVNETAGRAFTALPAVGDRVDRGGVVYEVDGVGIPLFYGARPMWRDLEAGVTPGSDVAQLNDNLIALGFNDHGRLTPGDSFTAHTTAAVEAWQRARFRTADGVVHVGDVVDEPGPVRIASVAATLGGPPQPGTLVALATSPTPDVVIEVPVTQEYLVHVGDAVTVTLPDGTTTMPGTIFAVGSVAVAPGDSSNGNASPGPANAGGSGGGNQPDTVDVTVALADPTRVAAFSSAAVTVQIVSAQAKNVLAVPINALVALAEGGYAVEVVDGAQHHLVGVHPGLFANSLVEITGTGLTPGTRVEVPRS